MKLFRRRSRWFEGIKYAERIGYNNANAMYVRGSFTFYHKDFRQGVRDYIHYCNVRIRELGDKGVEWLR